MYVTRETIYVVTVRSDGGMAVAQETFETLDEANRRKAVLEREIAAAETAGAQ